LIETESEALLKLGRPKESVSLMQLCIKMRVDNPERFPRDQGIGSCYTKLAHSLCAVGGRLQEAEFMLKKALASLESEGKVIHPEVCLAMFSLGQVYTLQGHKKEAEVMAKKVKKLVPQIFPKDHPDYKNFMEKC
jgi:hypothetical protein